MESEPWLNHDWSFPISEHFSYILYYFRQFKLDVSVTCVQRMTFGYNVTVFPQLSCIKYESKCLPWAICRLLSYIDYCCREYTLQVTWYFSSLTIVFFFIFKSTIILPVHIDCSVTIFPKNMCVLSHTDLIHFLSLESFLLEYI